LSQRIMSSFLALSSHIAQDVCVVIIMFLLTIGRIAAQRWQKKMQHSPSYRKSDIVATAFLAFCTAVVIVQVALAQRSNYILYHIARSAAEKNMLEISPSVVVLNFMQSFLNVFGIWALKGMYLSTFFGMTLGMSTWTLRGLYATTMFCISGFLASVFLYAFWCRPFWLNWHLDYTSTGFAACHVGGQVNAQGIFMALNVAADFMIVAICVAVVRSVRVTEKLERVAIVIVFVIGLTSIAAAVVRWGCLYYSQISIHNAANIVYTGRLLELFTRLEIPLGAVAYTLPVSRLLIRKLLHGASNRLGISRMDQNNDIWSPTGSEELKHGSSLGTSLGTAEREKRPVGISYTSSEV